MPDNKTIYLPRQRTRPGFSHSYQAKAGTTVVVIDEKGKTAKAGQDPSVIATEKPTKRGRTGDGA